MQQQDLKHDPDSDDDMEAVNLLFNSLVSSVKNTHKKASQEAFEYNVFAEYHALTKILDAFEAQVKKIITNLLV